jgi:hypothetical protein
LYREAVEDVGDGRKEDALEKLGWVLETDPEHVGACQLMADNYLNNEQFEAAGALCNRTLEIDTWLAWPHLFLGLICRQKGDSYIIVRPCAIQWQMDRWLRGFAGSGLEKIATFCAVLN